MKNEKVLDCTDRVFFSNSECGVLPSNHFHINKRLEMRKLYVFYINKRLLMVKSKFFTLTTDC